MTFKEKYLELKKKQRIEKKERELFLKLKEEFE
jgi:hypothetical protein